MYRKYNENFDVWFLRYASGQATYRQTNKHIQTVYRSKVHTI